MLTIPLIEELTKGPVPPGSNLLVEFEPTSQWYNASITIAAGFLKQNGKVSYTTWIQPPARLRSALNRLGIDCARLETGPQQNELLRIWDYYTPTLGQKSNEKLNVSSLKVPDLSIFFSRDSTGMRGPTIPDRLRMDDNHSVLARFNEEKSWVEFVITRVLPIASLRETTLISGFMKGVHSEWAISQLEGACDGVIDFKLEEDSKITRDLMRIRSMRDVGYDREWHELKIGENAEIRLEK